MVIIFQSILDNISESVAINKDAGFNTGIKKPDPKQVDSKVIKDPKPVKPDPKPVKPDPKPVDSKVIKDPKQVDSKVIKDPKPVKPDPKQVDSKVIKDPKPVKPDPKQVDTESDPVQPYNTPVISPVLNIQPLSITKPILNPKKPSPPKILSVKESPVKKENSVTESVSTGVAVVCDELKRTANVKQITVNAEYLEAVRKDKKILCDLSLGNLKLIIKFMKLGNKESWKKLSVSGNKKSLIELISTVI
jgi:hypothetical protein